MSKIESPIVILDNSGSMIAPFSKRSPRTVFQEAVLGIVQSTQFSDIQARVLLSQDGSASWCAVDDLPEKPAVDLGGLVAAFTELEATRNVERVVVLTDGGLDVHMQETMDAAKRFLQKRKKATVDFVLMGDMPTSVPREFQAAVRGLKSKRVSLVWNAEEHPMEEICGFAPTRALKL